MNRTEFFKKLFLLPFFPFGLKKLLGSQLNHKIKILSDSYVAGFVYYDGETCIHQLKKGDELILKAEPENPHDGKAVEIYFKNKKLGYIPRYNNEASSKFLQEGYTLSAFIEKVRPGADSWEKVSFDIWFHPN
ncbi:MAG: HIRAN domain-containing protein [Balneola sp.]